MPRVILLIALMVGCSANDPLIDRTADIPVVDSVSIYGDGEKTLIHVCDWHHVSIKDFRKELPAKVTAAEVELLHSEFLRTIADVQIEQQMVLTSLDVKRVWLEGLIDDDGYHRLRVALREAKDFPDLESIVESDATEMGAAARMIIDGEELEVMSAEDLEIHQAGYPLREGVTEADMERQENELVRRIVAAGESPAVLICGGDHEFSDNVPDGWQVVRVEVAAWQVATVHLRAAGNWTRVFFWLS